MWFRDTSQKYPLTIRTSNSTGIADKGKSQQWQEAIPNIWKKEEKKPFKTILSEINQKKYVLEEAEDSLKGNSYWGQAVYPN